MTAGEATGGAELALLRVAMDSPRRFGINSVPNFGTWSAPGAAARVFGFGRRSDSFSNNEGLVLHSLLTDCSPTARTTNVESPPAIFARSLLDVASAPKNVEGFMTLFVALCWSILSAGILRFWRCPSSLSSLSSESELMNPWKTSAASSALALASFWLSWCENLVQYVLPRSCALNLSSVLLNVTQDPVSALETDREPALL